MSYLSLSNDYPFPLCESDSQTKTPDDIKKSIYVMKRTIMFMIIYLLMLQNVVYRV